MSILIFFVVLFVLILVHEFGHFWVAKKTGMRVDEFGIGFPPKLFGIQKGETEYTLNALPIGGFVRIFGEDAIAVEKEGGTDIGRAFCNRSKWAQVAVLVAGVTANVLFAWLLLTLVFTIGTEHVVEESAAGENAQLVVLESLEGGPAHAAGISTGAVITDLSVNDTRLTSLTPTNFIAFIEEYGDTELSITYTVGEDTVTADITPELGAIEAEPDRPALGIALGMTETISYPIHRAALEGLTQTFTMLGSITVAIFTLLKDAFVLDADLSQIAGPIGIVALTGEVSALGIVPLLLFTAVISLNLAVINILPFPALDGGRLLFVAIEALKGSPIRPQVAYALNAVGFVLLILLIIVVSYNDILRIL